MLVVRHRNVIEGVLEHRGSLRELQARERVRLTAQLLGHLLRVVGVDVAVPARPNEVADLKARLLGEHVGEQGVGRDVEGNAQEHVRAALVKLQRQAAVGHVQLEERVAGLERHLRQIADVPRGYHHAARIRVRLQRLEDLGNLVDVATIPGIPRTPLDAVHRAQLAVLVRPLVPDADAIVLEPGHVRRTRQEPQEFADHRLEVHALRRDQREALRQVVAQLRPEHGTRARAGAVTLGGALAHNARQQVLVLAVDGAHVSRSARSSTCARPAAPGRRPSARSCSCARWQNRRGASGPRSLPQTGRTGPGPARRPRA